jgi:hypothetical protein
MNIEQSNLHGEFGDPKRRHWRWALLFFVILGSAGMWSYWRRLPLVVHALTSQSDAVRPKALSDLYPRWYGTRELLLRHRDPYGIEVSREIQVAFYGRVLDHSRPNEPRDEQRFAYPLYVVFFLAPTTHMDFSTVRTIYWWLLEAAVALTVFFWLRFFRIHLRLPNIVAASGLLLSIPALQGVSLLQLGLLVSCLLSAAALAAVSEHLFFAGCLLALATIKPQLSALPVAWFLLWACSDWRSRRSLFVGFAATLAILILISEYLLPGWLLRYPSALRAYAGYTSATSLVGVLFPRTAKWVVTALALVAAVPFCWRARRDAANSAAFILAFCFVLTLTVLIVPTVVAPFNHILLVPVALLMGVYWKDLRRADLFTRSTSVVFLAFAILPWLLASLLTFVPSHRPQSWLMWSAPLSASLALPFAAFGCLLLLRRLDPPAYASRASSDHKAEAYD